MDFIIKLQDQRLTSFKELGEIMYLYPDASEKLITSSKFLKILKQVSQAIFKTGFKAGSLPHRLRRSESGNVSRYRRNRLHDLQSYH